MVYLQEMRKKLDFRSQPEHSEVMILHFSVSNFRAFRGLQSLNLTASNSDKSLPSNLITPELPGLKKHKWVKGASLYGANASGKSTLLEALKALISLVATSAKTTDPHAPIQEIEPFALDPQAENEPTAFAIVFVNQGVRYEYRVAATRKRIYHESLRSFPKGPERLWFIRDWSDELNAFTFMPESPKGLPRNRDIEKRTLPNMLYLSKGIAEGRSELEPIYRWLVESLKFLDLSAKKSGMGRRFTMQHIESDDHSMRTEILKLLRHADIGITDARVTERSPSNEELELIKDLPNEVKEGYLNSQMREPELSHKSAGENAISLPWKSESAGTQRLFALSGPWLDILKNGYTVCVDELETSMHPLMVRELLKLFFSEKTNPNNAQIIFTTHDPLLLDMTLIRRDQIWLTDKDTKGRAHLYPLLDYKPRGQESLVRGYMAGRYGAIPFIPDGLLGEESAGDEVLKRKEIDE